MADLTCDVAVIGAGTAGIVAEKRARERGAKTLLIDSAFPGTTCASVGCMPSKLLIAAADAAWSVQHAETFGIRASAEVDGPALFTRLRAERDRFVAGVKRSIDRLPEDIRIRASASFLAPGRLSLSDGRTVSARAIVIATGSSPAVPEPFAALDELILTNDSIFELDDLPGSVAVVGAGPVGLELGQALARLGVRVEVFNRGADIGGMQPPEISATLKALVEREVPIHVETEIEAEHHEGGLRVRWDGREDTFDRLLVATGRPPNLDSLNLDAAELELDENGAPLFNPETMQCGDAPVFIAGDVNHYRPLLHEASFEGARAGVNAASFPKTTPNPRKVPLAITFTRPEAASVGEAPEPGDADIFTASASYDNQGRARVEGRTGGLCHLYAHRDGRLTGATLCAPNASHLAHLLAWAIGAGMKVSELLDMPFYHPTLEEGLRPALRELCTMIGAEDSAEEEPPGA